MDDISYLDLHGDRVAYRDSGDSSGPETLLLIHGMAGSSTTWRDVMPRLAKNYRVIAPDLLGHGLSDKPRGDYSLGAFAVWLRDFLDELNIPRVTVIGQSLGGGIAMQFAYQHRERCDRVVLIGSGGLGPDLSWMLRLLSVPGAELLLPALAPKPVLSAGNAIRGWLSSAGLRSPRGAEMWSAVSSLSDADSRTAFLRTLRSVVDTAGSRSAHSTSCTYRHSSRCCWCGVIRIGSSPSRTATPRMRRCPAAGWRSSPGPDTFRMSRRQSRWPTSWRISSRPPSDGVN